MSIAAVPNYLQKNPDFYLSAPPGHRFLLYFPIWGENGETKMPDWRTKDRVKKFKQQKGQQVFAGWTDIENSQHACTIAAGKTPSFSEDTPRARRPAVDSGLKPWRSLMESLVARQSSLAGAFADQKLLAVPAVATAPFTTGLGNEHPLENGFAFLNPYGLPYLPGSGVKGVLRQAARELACGMWGETRGWSENKLWIVKAGDESIELSLIDVLFGLESASGSKAHVRAALSFWDVIPQIAGDDELMVEIMTPHQGHYYQWKKDKQGNPIPESPHDSGSPIPLSFLTVPPGSGFTFHVVCDQAHLERLTANGTGDAPDLLAEGDRHWKTLLRAAFEHAFEWLGFGAKTAVGYGAMQALTEEQIQQQRQQQQAEALRCAWVDETIERLVREHKSNPDEVLRGKALANAWKALEDESLKAAALADIRARWVEHGWWESPPGGRAAKQARAIYAEQQ